MDRFCLYHIRLTNEEWKRLAHDVFHILAMHAGLVYDITDTDCWAQNGSTHAHVLVTFKLQFVRNGMRHWVQKMVSIFYFLAIDLGFVLSCLCYCLCFSLSLFLFCVPASTFTKKWCLSFIPFPLKGQLMHLWFFQISVFKKQNERLSAKNGVYLLFPSHWKGHWCFCGSFKLCFLRNRTIHWVQKMILFYSLPIDGAIDASVVRLPDNSWKLGTISEHHQEAGQQPRQPGGRRRQQRFQQSTTTGVRWRQLADMITLCGRHLVPGSLKRRLSLSQEEEEESWRQPRCWRLCSLPRFRFQSGLVLAGAGASLVCCKRCPLHLGLNVIRSCVTLPGMIFWGGGCVCVCEYEA